MNVSVEDALKAFGIQYTKIPEHFRVLCPFHDDQSNPNGQIHHKTGFYICWSCGKRTSLALFLSRRCNLPVYQVKTKLGHRSDCKSPIDPQDIERCHQEIWKNSLFLKELADRCITEKIIRERRLGVFANGNERRIAIPIPNEVGEYANIRQYLPGAPDRKFLNLNGSDRAKIRLYPVDQLEYDQILVCGGELKALAAAEVLNPYGIGAVSPTCGESTWPNELTFNFQNKLVWVNCDVDDTGEKYSEVRCRILKPVVRELHKYTLTSEQVGGLEHGDINDALRLAPKTKFNLYDELIKCPEWEFVPGGELETEPPLDLSFRDAYGHENVGRKVRFPGIISGILPEDFKIPCDVEVQCPGNLEYCQNCDVNMKRVTGETLMHIESEHRLLLAIAGEDDNRLLPIYKECFNIPKKCDQCKFIPKKYYSVREGRLEEQVEPTSRVEPMAMKIAYFVNASNNLLDTEAYLFEGRLYPAPKTQKSSFVISSCIPTQNTLDSYEPSPSDFLADFQPKKWDLDSLQIKLDEIYSDIEANVTKIWHRRDYHISLDLAYHSMLHFDFANAKNQNAYVQLLIVGDTAQGKSEAVKALRNHYGLGKVIDSAQVTLPGLTIGLDRMGTGKYFTSIGAMPKNDRQLLIFEELKKMKSEILQRLTEVRSSGMVEINKIEHKSRRARVRIIAITNCIESRKISSYAYGIESAIGIIGTNEDLRRFDLVMTMGEGDVPIDMPERRNPPVVKHNAIPDLCQKLVLKAWKCEHTEFENVGLILDVTKKLVDKFGYGLPILDTNSSHLKIAKLCAALAARTCSYNEEVLVVRDCHVLFIEDFLTRVYSSQSSRLDEKSRSVRDATLLRNRDGLVIYLKTVPNIVDVLDKIKDTDILTSQFIREVCGDLGIGSMLFSKLILSNAISKVKGDKYAKTPEFMNLLKSDTFVLPLPGYLKNREKF